MMFLFNMRSKHLKGRTFEAVMSLQEDDAAQIVTYPRELDGVVRKTDDRRKLARKRKAERAEAAAAQRLAEVKRLKNLKRGEVDERLAEIQRISGHQSRAALSKLLEADFDPEAYDAAMAAAFDAEYYQVMQAAQFSIYEMLEYIAASLCDSVGSPSTFCTIFRKLACHCRAKTSRVTSWTRPWLVSWQRWKITRRARMHWILLASVWQMRQFKVLL